MPMSVKSHRKSREIRRKEQAHSVKKQVVSPAKPKRQEVGVQTVLTLSRFSNFSSLGSSNLLPAASLSPQHRQYNPIMTHHHSMSHQSNISSFNSMKIKLSN